MANTPADQGVPPGAAPLGRIGRYVVFDEIASGGAATVHFGRLEGASGFARVVALKRLHPHVAKDERSAAILRDEAWLSSRVRHPNAVAVLDVVEEAGELVLVMEYVEGTTLATLLARLNARGALMPMPIAGAIVAAMLAGLEAAHVATAEDGTPLDLVHRDVSPQNVLVGFDGSVRLADFGVAKARGRLQTTHEGELKGKFAYMAPEQVSGKVLTRATDLYASGAVLWECIGGRRLHQGDEPAAVLTSVLYGDVASLGELRAGLPAGVGALVRRALAKEPSGRFESAAEMGEAVERTVGCANARELAAFVAELLGEEPARLRAIRARVECAVLSDVPPLSHSRLLPPASSVASTPPREAPPEKTVRVASKAESIPRSRSRLPVRMLGVLVALLVAYGLSRFARQPIPASGDSPRPSQIVVSTVGPAPTPSTPALVPLPSTVSTTPSGRPADARPAHRPVVRPVRPTSAGTTPGSSASLPSGLVGIPSDRE